MNAFKCPECQNYFDAPQFSPKEMEKGPWCPLCSARLERIPVDVLSRKPATEGVLGGDVDIVEIGKLPLPGTEW